MSTAVNPPPDPNNVSTTGRDSDMGQTEYIPVTPDRRGCRPAEGRVRRDEVRRRLLRVAGGHRNGCAAHRNSRSGGTALGYTTNVNTTNPTAGEVQSVGIAGGIALLAIIFVAYFWWRPCRRADGPVQRPSARHRRVAVGSPPPSSLQWS